MTASLSPAIIDTHCHLDVEAFDQDRLMVLERARVNGVQGMVVPGVDASGWPGLIALCGTQPDLYPALGLHPIYSRRHKDADLELLEALIERERPTAIGEIGLDFFIENPDEERQQYLFECQLAIAGAAGLPVVLHVRKAHDQVLHTLKRMSIRQGVAHAFSGSYEQAKRYIDFGFVLGFGGMLTYERSRKLRALAKQLPLDSIVLETDAPDLTVSAHHGERNSPEYLPDCLASLAEVKGLDKEEVARATTENASRIFDLANI